MPCMYGIVQFHIKYDLIFNLMEKNEKRRACLYAICWIIIKHTKSFKLKTNREEDMKA